MRHYQRLILASIAGTIVEASERTPILRYCELFYRHIAFTPQSNETSNIPDIFRMSAPAEFAEGCLRTSLFNRTRSFDVISQLQLFNLLQPTQGFFSNVLDQVWRTEPFSINASLSKIARKIADEKYKDDYTFNLDVWEAFAAYRDINTQFYPKCAMTFTYHHQYPLLAVSKDVDSQPDIFLANMQWSETDHAFSVQPGDQVVQIDGLDSIVYLTNLTNSPELYLLDVNARWNSLFVHRTTSNYKNTQVWSVGAFAERKLWEGRHFNLTLTNGTNVTTKWQAKLDERLFNTTQYEGLPFQDESSFLFSYCENDSMMVMDQKSIKVWADNMLVAITPAPVITSKSGNLRAYEVKSKNPDQKAYVLNNQFLYNRDSHELSLDTVEFVNQLKEKISGSDDKSNIIFDLTSTLDAQSIDIVPDLVRLFLPDYSSSLLGDFRRNPLLDQIISNATMSNSTLGTAYQVSKWVDASQKPFPSIDDFLKVEQIQEDQYTQRFRLNYSQTAPKTGKNSVFAPENMVIITDGLCAGACAVFVHDMEEQGVKTVALGGTRGNSTMQAVGGGRGGRFLMYKDLLWTLEKLDIPAIHANNSNFMRFVPHKLPIQATAAVTIENKFRGQSSVPEELVYRPASKQISWTHNMIYDVRNIWVAALDFLHTAQSGGL